MIDAARQAFTHAASIAYIAGAVGVIAAAVVSFVVLRDVEAAGGADRGQPGRAATTAR